MLSTVLVVFLLLLLLVIVIVIFLEYKNEKKYQESRKKKTLEKKNTPHRHTLKKHTPTKKQAHTFQEIASKQSISTKDNIRPSQQNKPTIQSTIKAIPHKKYPIFSHERLIKMGLSEDEVLDFVKELIPQIEIQIPLIKEAIEHSDFHQAERLTHSIKGSSSTVGTGGVSELLLEYNTYLKSGTDTSIINTYFQDLIYYTNALKIQYT